MPRPRRRRARSPRRSAGPGPGCSAARSPCADDGCADMTDRVPDRGRGDPGQGRGGPDRCDGSCRARAYRGWTWSWSSTTAAPTARPSVAREAGAEVVRHARNRGKAAAMTTGAGYVARHEGGRGPRGRLRRPATAALRRRRPGGQCRQRRCARAAGARGPRRHDDRHAAPAEDGRRRARVRGPAGAQGDRGPHRVRRPAAAVGDALHLARRRSTRPVRSRGAGASRSG